jgi:hypothetical protein
MYWMARRVRLARMVSKSEPAAAGLELERASERWRSWLVREVALRRQPSAAGLLVLWEVLEEWFASDDFAESAVAAAVAAPPDGRGPAAHAVLARHRKATHRLLEELAREGGVRDPAALAGQLLVLVEGAIVGALVDRNPGVARRARELTELALTAAAPNPAADPA